METKEEAFNLTSTIQQIKKYLPTQGPLKDYVFLNALQSFQDQPFHEAMKRSSEIFGYKTYLDINEYRDAFKKGEIRKELLDKFIVETKGAENYKDWYYKLTEQNYEVKIDSRVGELRKKWKKFLKIDIDNLVHLNLFRIIGAYLDQGISIWNFPSTKKGLRNALVDLEKNSFSSFFQTEKVKALLLDPTINVVDLLKLIVGKESCYFNYLFDQQFAHPGWSGMVAYLETNPHVLLDKRSVSLEDFIFVELLLEIDTLEHLYSNKWSPLGELSKLEAKDLFAPTKEVEICELLKIWQEAYEWSYYDEVLAYISKQEMNEKEKNPSFQALFCIDDRECSFRRYIEQVDPNAETYGTAGFFNLEFYYQPDGAKFLSKLCPAPLTPKYLVLEKSNYYKHKKEVGFSSKTHGLFIGWFLSQTLGFWAAFKLLKYIFRPSYGNTTVSSFQHMSPTSTLVYEYQEENSSFDGLTIGYTLEEMTDRMEGLLKSIGFNSNFAPIIYIIGHGSTSANNAYYSTMDCGACSCKPGSVNARLAALMLNREDVRKNLETRGLLIPNSTQFLGGLHDTAQDEIIFYDLTELSEKNRDFHLSNQEVLNKALLLNAKERSRRFMSIDSRKPLEKIHNSIKSRTFSLFEPRPELDHATNTLCIVGRRGITKNLFLDRRAFLNSYDYSLDLEGAYLLTILKAVTPVCGGINLAYYFSKVDNQKFGSGSKLPHNIVGLFGVANGIEGDLRPGLPKQMVEVHDAMRLMCIVEHYPDVVKKVLFSFEATYEWYKNDWIKLVVLHPETKELFVLEGDLFKRYQPLKNHLKLTHNLQELVGKSHENIPIHQIV